MTPRLRPLLASGAVVLALALAGCGGDDDASTTTVAPADTTPAELQTAVFERAYSECASTPLNLLAAKYNAQKNKKAVSTAVAEAWRRQFGAGNDALADGRAGCLQGFRDV